MKQVMLALLAAALVLPNAGRAADGPDAEAKYQEMLAAAKAKPSATDWQALRFAYADRPSFSLHAADEGRRAINAATKSGNWQSVLDAANRLLDVNYVDGQAHLAASAAYIHPARQSR